MTLHEHDHEYDMGKSKKLFIRILSGNFDKNISFANLCLLLDRLGFKKRIRGSHHIYTREDIEEILNLQSKDNKAKPYQVKQVRNVILKYRLRDGNDV